MFLVHNKSNNKVDQAILNYAHSLSPDPDFLLDHISLPFPKFNNKDLTWSEVTSLKAQFENHRNKLMTKFHFLKLCSFNLTTSSWECLCKIEITKALSPKARTTLSVKL